jgi:hypothetical protein
LKFGEFSFENWQRPVRYFLEENWTNPKEPFGQNRKKRIYLANRGGRPRIFRAFVLASTKQKKSVEARKTTKVKQRKL